MVLAAEGLTDMLAGLAVAGRLASLPWWRWPSYQAPLPAAADPPRRPGAPPGISYRCTRCEVRGFGLACWCCSRRDELVRV